MRVAILAHEHFPGHAKTAIGFMRYSSDEVVAVLDRTKAGTRVHDHIDFVPDAKIVAGMDDVGDVDALLVGISPIGGSFDESWRPDVRAALDRGIDVIAGLHTFLSEDEEFASLANANGASIDDVRRPPDGLGVSKGVAANVEATVLLTVGTDASVGKMTTTFELVEGLRDVGVDAAPVPTGQTGIMIDGSGIAIDRVVADFLAGATEQLVLERAPDNDVLVVEGQGSIIHPAYSGLTAGLLHGSMPDGLILCHDFGREHIRGYEQTPIPPVAQVRDLYEQLARPIKPAPVWGVSANTSTFETERDASNRLDALEDELGVPVADMIRFGPAPLVDQIRDVVG